MRPLLLAAAAVALAALLGTAAHAFPARVTDCHDGDTCTLVAGGSGERITVRLHGIDAPELGQPYGAQSRDLINNLVAGKAVDVRPAGHSYNRTVADLVLPDGRNVAAVMIDAGAAWWEPKYPSDPTLPARQAQAQQRHAGLWADPAAVPPWQWRHTYAHSAPHRSSWGSSE
jgi:micrococcal nuclease